MKRRTFTEHDQREFAQLSGDWNPIHVDPEAARRLLFGECVVHGVHATLWALNELADERQPRRLRRLAVRFRKPIPVGALADLRLVREDGASLRARVELDGLTAVSLDVECAEIGPEAEPCAPPRASDRAPRAVSGAEISGLRGRLPVYLDAQAARTMLPDLRHLASPLQLAQLLATTRLVGMECPGQHSIFASLDLDFGSGDEPGPDALAYEVAEWDERFARAELDVRSAGLRGRLAAFLRPAPTRQRSCAELEGVEPGEFRGERALVVGGSRGLGETTAKLLALGGADVRLTFNTGRGDAQAVVAEIAACGGSASAARLDVRDPSSPGRLLDGTWTPTLVGYFASPPIARSDRPALSEPLLARFREHYVLGFERLLAAARAQSSAPLGVLFPSTVFLDEEAPGFREYKAAKAEGEELCARLEQSGPGLVIHRPRLPRLATDQTASLLGEEAGDPVPVLLEALRRLHRARREPSEAR